MSERGFEFKIKIGSDYEWKKIEQLDENKMMCPFCTSIREARTNICENCSILILKNKINEIIHELNKGGCPLNEC